MNEDQLQEVVCDAAAVFGWWRAHFRPLRTKHGWRVPGQYESGAGWPDLLLVRGAELLVWELKGPGGQVTPDQWDWLLAWQGVDGAEVAVVTPGNLDGYALTRLARKPVWRTGPPSANQVIGFDQLTPKGRVRS